MQETQKFARTHRCGELSISDVGKHVTLCGWVARRRDLGGLIFVTLRDVSGIIQCVFNESENSELFNLAFTLRSECTVMIQGVVAERDAAAKNPKMKTGSIEVLARSLTIYSRAETTPFEIVENSNANEALRMKYRYLDLRRPDIQQIIVMRHKIAQETRRFFSSEGFFEIETPLLVKSTPEGARDYLVPSRVHPGKFYALPQSPQQYKQLLMVAGFDRYFQIARCLRDEDLRVDRQPEFTQVDLEMSFVDAGDILDVSERYIAHLYKTVLGREIKLPLPRMTYHEAMERYGSDKPDLRFGYEIHNISDIVRGCGFNAFDGAIAGGGSVRAIKINGGAEKFSRKEIDALTVFVKTYRAGGLAWIKKAQGASSASFAKFVPTDVLDRICNRVGAEDGDIIFIIADNNSETVLTALGALRCECARKTGVAGKDETCLLWVTDFPYFEFSEEENRYVARHHPFTAPQDEDWDILESDPEKVRAKAYDMVLNGFELGGGSIRMHNSEQQSRMFRARLYGRGAQRVLWAPD
jgi:aspartyl-tRNA synthetase